MRRFRTSLGVVPATLLLVSLPALAADKNANKSADLDTRPHIDVVFAIDCSGSMGGVINTAKQKIWGIVNEIAKAKPSPVLRIGLHGYGNADNMFRNFPLSDDLDQVYANLMTFKDEGWSSEYVGLSVQKTTNEMDWKDWEKSGASNVLRVLYVVGNETAEQGPISYKVTAPEALKKQIFVNAIYCGEDAGSVASNPAAIILKNSSSTAGKPRVPNQMQMAASRVMMRPHGLPSTQPNQLPLSQPTAGQPQANPQQAPPPQTQQKNAVQIQAPRIASAANISEIETWRELARLGGGEFGQIAASGGGVTIPTPYDTEFTTLNTKLNGTYLAYGASGKSYAKNQATQDFNSAAVGGSANLASRALAKSSAQYNNRRWDLVDASKEKDFDLAKFSKEELPTEIRNLSPNDQKKYIAKKGEERAALQKQIGDLGRKREEFVQAELKKKNMSLDQALDEQILRSIRQQATKRGFKF